MPTSRSGRSLPSEPHQARQWAESFGSDPERYDRARPRYPDALLERLVATAPGPDVLDVGCGTGIVARQLRAAGCRVLGVEVDPRMADWARRDGLEVEVAAFESWDPAGRTFDAVVSGQTWHWIDPAAGAARAAHALRPGGLLAAFWNVGVPSPEIAEAFAEVARRVVPELPMLQQTAASAQAYTALLDKAADGIRRTNAFGAPERWEFGWRRSYTRDEWLDQIPTSGFAGQLGPEKLRELLAGVGEVIDAAGGGFTMDYTTVTIAATRADAPVRPA
ncbi:class I SAM-dependent methyltransferase [Actinomadura kijaniata]|uniref:class I SAM-dependent methyltransferase n=1 Tax=Actinomadura kijaniata TaxID=46161 RepID=UPI0008328392|nr:class I SAM-dependent methyltransferase [Actinomadura kijaniata]